jgi:hypothetical protein
MSQVEVLRLVLDFVERNQTITVFAISMGIVGFALYVVLRTIQGGISNNK